MVTGAGLSSPDWGGRGGWAADSLGHHPAFHPHTSTLMDTADLHTLTDTPTELGVTAGSMGGASPPLSPHVNNQGLLNWPLSSCPWTSHRFARPSPGPLHAPQPRPCLKDPPLLLNPVCAPVVPRSPQRPPSARYHPASKPPGPLQPSGSVPVTWPRVTAIPRPASTPTAGTPGPPGLTPPQPTGPGSIAPSFTPAPPLPRPQTGLWEPWDWPCLRAAWKTPRTGPQPG